MKSHSFTPNFILLKDRTSERHSNFLHYTTILYSDYHIGLPANDINSFYTFVDSQHLMTTNKNKGSAENLTILLGTRVSNYEVYLLFMQENEHYFRIESE